MGGPTGVKLFSKQSVNCDWDKAASLAPPPMQTPS